MRRIAHFLLVCASLNACASAPPVTYHILSPTMWINAKAMDQVDSIAKLSFSTWTEQLACVNIGHRDSVTTIEKFVKSPNFFSSDSTHVYIKRGKSACDGPSLHTHLPLVGYDNSSPSCLDVHTEFVRHVPFDLLLQIDSTEWTLHRYHALADPADCP